MQFDAIYLGDRRQVCDVLIDSAGVALRFGRKIIRYGWEDVPRISFDDPGRTKANVGAIVAFGVLGLAARTSYTFVNVSTTTEELFFEQKNPIQMWRGWARRLGQEVPFAEDRIFVDGLGLKVDQPRADSTSGWYPDPYGAQCLRWYDGQIWSEHTAPLPAPPPPPY